MEHCFECIVNERPVPRPLIVDKKGRTFLATRRHNFRMNSEHIAKTARVHVAAGSEPVYVYVAMDTTQA